jgi:Family of unknown function (DUF6152)
MKALTIGGLLVVALCIAVTAYAHHSAAGIDQTKTVTQEGIVKQFKWANPHSWLEIEVPNGKGGTDIWNLEMNPPAYLVRAGWKSTTVKPGEKIKFTARPFKNGDPGGLFVNVILADGRVLGNNAPRGSAPPATPGAAAPGTPATPPTEQK